METQTIKNLLSQVSAIIQQYDKMAELTGENFNVFKILGVETKEVRMHSAFIAELLNPDGSHGQGEVFLKLFVEQLNIKDFNTEKAKIEVERHVGFITDDKTEGGYIDIIATDKNNNAIIIENKIYAGDQENQLKRYYNYGKKNCTNFNLIYLTLDGKTASEFSTNDLNEGDYQKISYATDILNWLENCKKEAVNHPILRESITQYINLIKYLTGQTMEDKEIKEIITAIKNNKSNLEALQELSDNDIWETTRETILEDLGKRLFNDIKNEFELESGSYNAKSFGEKEFDFWFYKKEWKYCIYFYYEDDYDTISYGIDVVDDKKYKRLSEEKERFKKLLGISEDDSDWIWKKDFKEYDDTSWYELTTEKGVEIFKIAVKQIMDIDGIEKLMKG